MKNMTEEFPIYEFRPLYKGEMLRYNKGKWTKDDGKYDLAFIETNNPVAHYITLPYQDNLLWSWCKNMNWNANIDKHPNGNAWHYMSKNKAQNWGNGWERDKHPNIIAGNAAMDKCCSKFSSANGRGVDFYVNDPTILKGSVRELETKKIVVPPMIFNCIYCGEINWKKEEKNIIK